MRGKLQFTLADLLWAVTLTALSLSLLGLWGLAVAAFLLAAIVYVRKAKSRPAAVTRVIPAIVAGFCILSAVEIVPRSRRMRTRNVCASSLHGIGLALANYASSNDKLPPVCESDGPGMPPHSWRFLLCPCFCYMPPYWAYNRKEAWNGPNNSKLIVQMPPYACPEDPKARKKGTTSYVAVVGPDGNWLADRMGSQQLSDSGLVIEAPASGVSNPVLVIEAPAAEIIWTEPRDLSLDEACRVLSSPRGPHASYRGSHGAEFFTTFIDSGGSNALFADGSVQGIPFRRRPQGADPGGPPGPSAEQNELADYQPSLQARPHWPNIVRLALLATCAVWMLVRPRKMTT